MYTGNKKLKVALFNAFTYAISEQDIDNFIESLKNSGYLIIEKGVKIPLLKQKVETKQKFISTVSTDLLIEILEEAIVTDKDSYSNGWNNLATAFISGLKKIKNKESVKKISCR